MVKKTHVLHVMLNEDEYLAYKNCINKMGETLSRFTRKLIRQTINGEVDLLLDEQSGFKIAIRQLAGMANNLNQVTAAIHAGVTHRSVDTAYLQEIKSYVRAVETELLNVIHKTTQRWVKNNAV